MFLLFILFLFVAKSRKKNLNYQGLSLLFMKKVCGGGMWSVYVGNVVEVEI